jgi:hypothetical protein
LGCVGEGGSERGEQSKEGESRKEERKDKQKEKRGGARFLEAKIGKGGKGRQDEGRWSKEMITRESPIHPTLLSAS